LLPCGDRNEDGQPEYAKPQVAELKIGLRQPSMDGAAICQTGAISLSRIAVHA